MYKKLYNFNDYLKKKINFFLEVSNFIIKEKKT